VFKLAAMKSSGVDKARPRQSSFRIVLVSKVTAVLLFEREPLEITGFDAYALALHIA